MNYNYIDYDGLHLRMDGGIAQRVTGGTGGGLFTGPGIHSMNSATNSISYGLGYYTDQNGVEHTVRTRHYGSSPSERTAYNAAMNAASDNAIGLPAYEVYGYGRGFDVNSAAGRALRETMKYAFRGDWDVPESNSGGSGWASAAIAFIAFDASVLDPSDAAWPKWVAYAAIGTAAATVLYINPTQDTWSTYDGLVYTVPHKADVRYQPINTPDPEMLPPNTPSGLAWLFISGYAIDNYLEYKNKFSQPLIQVPLKQNDYKGPTLKPKFYDYR